MLAVKACVDVHYQDHTAWTALVLFEDWTDAVPAATHLLGTRVTAAYVRGEFYRRELDPILRALKQTEVPLDVLVIDGYCAPSPQGRPGMGARLFEATDQVKAVIGVAKKPFTGATHARKVYRGRSSRPLFVTACGMDAEPAAQRIIEMRGRHRIPTLLKLADTLSRDSLTQ